MKNRSALVILLSLINVIAAAIMWISYVSGKLPTDTFVLVIFVIFIWQLLVVLLDYILDKRNRK